jgi:putative ABC transport system permease protein
MARPLQTQSAENAEPMHDLKFAIRALLKSPTFSLIAVVTLALGIGLNTSMFSLLNTMFLRPLPFPDSGALVRVFATTPQTRLGDLSPADYRELRAGEGAFGQFAASYDENVPVSAPGRPAALADALRVSANYLDVLRVRPELGRFFTPEEEAAGRDRVAMISHFFWVEQCGGSPEVLGRTLRINGEPHTVVGVLPETADDGRLIRHTAVFRPLGLSAAETASHGDPWLKVIGRRSGDVSEARGNAIVAAIGKRAAHDFPKEDGNSTWRAEALMGSTGSPTARVIVAMLIGLSGFVLLIACSNLANFLLARTIERARELSVQAALGASRFQLIRPVAIESLLLAAAGGAASIPVALWGSRWLSDQSVANGGSPVSFPLDWRVLGFAVAVSLVTGLFFGTAPALLISRMNLGRALGGGSRGATAGAGHQRLRRGLVIAQFAMAMTLTAGAAFLVRGADDLIRHHYGWTSENIVVGAVDLPKERYGTAAKILVFHRELLEKLRALPGVESVALGYWFPFSNDFGARAYAVEGRVPAVKGQEPTAAYNAVTPDYFRVTGTRLLQGRAFSEADNAGGARVAVISEGMARALFPDESPIGHRIAEVDADAPKWSEIVGVVGDVRTSGVYQRPPKFQVYQPLAAAPWQSAMVGIRTAPGASAEVLGRVGATVVAIDPDLPVRNLATADATVERTTFDLGMLKRMLGAFAVLGVALAALGIYGVVARTVAQRTREIGIRMALGATMADISRMIFRSALCLALIGAAAGVAGAAGITRLLSSMMPGVEGSAWTVAAASTAFLAIVALAASYLPARSAARVNPIDAIRSE